jgi:hypothetical protein
MTMVFEPMTRRNEGVASFCLIMIYFAGVAAAAGGSQMLVGFVFGAMACAATAVVTVAGECCY